MTISCNTLNPETFLELYRSVGRALMQAMEGYITESIPDGWAVSLELISSKGREAFYEKFGFEQRPCDWDGAGMIKMLRKGEK